jgi:mannitol/fructose-specific phosphotransferase system IIA component (Ntr-type)
VVFDCPDEIGAALDCVLATEYPANELRRIRRELLRGWPRSVAELQTGTVVIHASVRGITDPVTFLACNSSGIEIPGFPEPATLVFVLLSAPGSSDHLRHLEEITRLVGDPTRMAELQSARRAEDVMQALPRW